jgi:hypothetical protein
MALLQVQVQVQAQNLGYFVSVQNECRCRVWVGVISQLCKYWNDDVVSSVA